MLRAGLIAGISAPNMTRPTAMVEAAMFDAVNGIEKRYTPILVAPTGPASASRRAAAVQAAYVILSNLFGSRAVVAPAVPSPRRLPPRRRSSSPHGVVARDRRKRRTGEDPRRNGVG